ncbi:MAG TPA: heavy metal response regulator transcription factor [Burkholderiales bacterium]|nr:heavy metal response regulator transcription factor [Burkholderiales bacterium]
MKIVVVEDDVKTAAYLRKGLAESGYVVDVALDGRDGFHLATTCTCDLIILDALLPVIDGWTVLLRMRKTGLQTPVLFLTGRDSVEDRVRGLELGADDYLVKPFAFSELLARVRAILRRGRTPGMEVLHIYDLEIDFLHHRVHRAGERVELTQKEFALLSLLCRHQGEILSRTLIAEQVWDMNFDSDTNVVDVAIRRLRSKVDDPFNVRLIHSVRGAGYVLEDPRRPGDASLHAADRAQGAAGNATSAPRDPGQPYFPR